MDRNSPKHLETGKGEVSAVTVLRTWLDQVGGNHRIPQVLDILAQHAAQNLQSGHHSPPLDADTLRRLYTDAHGAGFLSRPPPDGYLALRSAIGGPSDRSHSNRLAGKPTWR